MLMGHSQPLLLPRTMWAWLLPGSTECAARRLPLSRFGQVPLGSCAATLWLESSAVAQLLVEYMKLLLGPGFAWKLTTTQQE